MKEASVLCGGGGGVGRVFSSVISVPFKIKDKSYVDVFKVIVNSCSKGN